MEGDCINQLEHMQVHSHLFHAMWSDGDCACLSVYMTVE